MSPLALLLVLAAAVGCGGGVEARETRDRGQEITSVEAAPCAEDGDEPVVVTLRRSGFAPRSTFVVRADGRAKASVQPPFGGPRCGRLSAQQLVDLRAALESAELPRLESQYDAANGGPDGMVVETVIETVTARGVSVVVETGADVPDRLADLLRLLIGAEGAVIESGQVSRR